MGNNLILRFFSTLKSYEYMIFLFKKCGVYFRKTFIRKKYIVKINLLKKLQMSLIVNCKIFREEDRHIIYIKS